METEERQRREMSRIIDVKKKRSTSEGGKIRRAAGKQGFPRLRALSGGEDVRKRGAGKEKELGR